MNGGTVSDGGQACSRSALTEYGNKCKPSFTCRVHLDVFKAQPAAPENNVWEILSVEEALDSLEHTIDLPSVETFIYILQKCRKRKNLGFAKHLHMHICDNGLEALSVLGDHLVPMFVECESLPDAEHVFHILGHQNECSWTALIQGYTEGGKPQHALHLFRTMQENGVYPSKFTLVALLRACARLKCLDSGEETYIEIVKEGFDNDCFVGTTLILMYAKCGSLKEAREVFEELLVRDVVSWNVLITGYSEYGHGEEALSCLEQMRLEGVSPNDVTFIWILKACGSLGVLNKGRALHTDIIKVGFESNPFIVNTLIDMYAKCGSFVEAWGVFNELLAHDVVSWTALISGYAEHGLGEEALNCLKSMGHEGVLPDVVTSVCGLKACASIGAIEKGQELHAEIAKEGYERGPFIGNTLVDMYAKCGLFAEACEVFNDLLVRDVVSWNALIAGFAEHELCEDGLNCFEQMQGEGMSPNAVTFVCSLKACGSVGAIDKAREIHAEASKVGLQKDRLVCITLVEIYAKCGSLAEAQKMYDELPVLDGFSWNSVIAGYVEHGLGVEALNCLEKMQMEGLCPDDVTFVCSLKACSMLGAENMGRELHGEVAKEGFEKAPFVGNSLVDMYAKFGSLVEAQGVFDDLLVRDVVTWTTLIAGYVEHGLGEEALKYVEHMISEGVLPTAITYACILKACSSVGAKHRGQEIHAEIILEGFEGDPSLGNTLVDMYAKCGSLAEAQEVFNELMCPDVVSWNSLIAGHAEHGFDGQVLKYLEQMKSQGVFPDVVTFLCSLKACASLLAIDRGHELYGELVKMGFERDPLIGNTLVDMYLKCTSLEESQHVFNLLSTRDIVTWNMLIRGYAERGLAKKALNCMKQLELEGMSPNAVTFVCNLKACGKLGAIDMGRDLHTDIVKEGFERDPLVCNILVDMYAKCGSPAEAQELFDELSHQSVISWNALIAGYTENGLAEEALNCFEQMQQEGLASDAITYVCSLKACSSTGALDRGQSIHAAIVSEGFERDPFIGNTLVDMYAKCGAQVEARALFDELLVQDVVSWNALMAGYAEHGGVEALNCLEQMQLEDVSQDIVTFVCSLKTCGIIEALDRGQEIHACITKEGFEADLPVGNTLVDMYAKCGSLAEARRVLDKLPVRDVRSWNALIAGLAEHGLGEMIDECLEEMQREGVYPNSVTYVCSLIVFGGLGALNRGRELHAELAKDGLEKNPFVGNTLVDMYGKCGSLTEAQDVFGELLDRDVVSWTALLAGYAEHGSSEEALRCLKEMQLDGVSPNVVSYNAAILGCAEQKEEEKAFTLFAQMQEQCLLPTNVTFMSTLKACCRPAALETGKRVHAQVHRIVGLEPMEVTMMTTTVIHMYGQCGSMVDAQQLFDEMPSRCNVSWNALIAGYVRQRKSDTVFNLFDMMREEGIHPDDVTFLSVLTACNHRGLLDKGQNYYAAMSKEYGITPNIKHHRCMLDLLGQAGQLNQAVVMLESMPTEPSLVFWSTVLDACKKWGNIELEKRALEKVAG